MAFRRSLLTVAGLLMLCCPAALAAPQDGAAVRVAMLDWSTGTLPDF